MKAERPGARDATIATGARPPGSIQRMVRRLAELGEQSAGELGQELWLKEGAGRGIPENTIATRYCRPAGKLLREAERHGWVTSRRHRNRWLWRVTHEGKRAVSPNARTGPQPDKP